MSKSRQPILVFNNDQELQAAVNSGWNPPDLHWERLQEKGNTRQQEGNLVVASGYFILAGLLATICFKPTDLRSLTSQANVAYICERIGFRNIARKHFRKLEDRWLDLSKFDWTDLEIKPRGRSSLFHVRMEALHWDQYRQNVTSRLLNFTLETGQCLGNYALGKEAPFRLYSRWKGEKYPIFDDTRKILGACLLLAGES